MSFKWLVPLPLFVLFFVGGDSANANPLLLCAAKVGIQFIGSYLVPKLMDEYVFNSAKPDIEKVWREFARDIKDLENSNKEMKAELKEAMKQELGEITKWLASIRKEQLEKGKELDLLRTEFDKFKKETNRRLLLLEKRVQDLDERVEILEAKDLERDKKLKPGSSRDYNYFLLRAKSFRDKGDEVRAITNLNVAATLHERGRCERGKYFHDGKFLYGAIKEYGLGIDSCLRIPKEQRDARDLETLGLLHYRRGNAYCDRKQFDPAIRDYLQAIEHLQDKTNRASAEKKKDELISHCVSAIQGADNREKTLALVGLFNFDPTHKALDGVIAPAASANGKYAKLTYRLNRPAATKKEIAEYSDSGTWTPVGELEGYWVYSYPYWYVWGDVRNK